MDYKSSIPELDRFLSSHVYDDMIATFEDWLAGAREKLEDETNINEVMRLQGSIRAMRDVLLWPENFRGHLEDLRNDD